MAPTTADTAAVRTRTMTVEFLRDYHMDPEVAAETGEDPVDEMLIPELDYSEFPFRVLDVLTCNYLYGEYYPADEDLPAVGESVEWGRVEFTEDGEIVAFEFLL